MTAARRAVLAALALVAVAAAPAKRDWTAVVAATPDGGYRIGNPAAPVKIVEYGSVWCSHCAHFHATDLPALKRDYIAGGKVSYELRNFVLNGADLPATIWVRCGGLPTYFQRLDTFYARQAEWQAPVLALADKDPYAFAQFAEMPVETRALAAARAIGLDKFVARLGATPAQFELCMRDPKAAEALEASNNRAVEQYGLDATPYFLLNGKPLAKTYDWKALEPQLRTALSGR